MPRRDYRFERPSSQRLEGRFLSAISLSGVGSILTLAASTLGGIIIARNAGPSGYGVFVAANLIVFVVSVICSFGLPLALAKHAAADEECGNYYASRRRQTTVLILLLLLVAGVSLALTVNGARVERQLNVPIGRGFFLLLPAILIAAVLSDYVQVIYIGLMRLWPVLAVTLAGPAAMIAYGLARRAHGSLPIWGAVAVVYGISGIVAVYFLIHDRLLAKPCPLSELKLLRGDVLPAAAFTLFSVFSVSIDRWVVGWALGGAGIGAYAAAVLVVQAALRIPKNVAFLIVPAATRATLAGPASLRRFSETNIYVLGFFAAITALVLMLIPGSVLNLLFGPGFVVASRVLLIMAPSLIASAIIIPFTSVLTGSAHNRFVTYLLAGTLIPRTLLLLLLTRKWGLTGTAVATLASETLLATICIFTAGRLSLHFPWRRLQEPVLIALLAYVCGRIVQLLTAQELIGAAFAVVLFAAIASRSMARVLRRSPGNPAERWTLT